MHKPGDPPGVAAADRHTLILPGAAVREAMSFAACVAAVEAAFASYARGEILLPPVLHLPATGGAFHIKTAATSGRDACVTVKVNGNFPDNRRSAELPTIQGVVVLCDRHTGFPLAILDSIEITAQRTGAATAVAARYLARPESETATIIGCGVQGRMQLQALRHVFKLKKVFVCDRDAAACRRFAADLAPDADFPLIPVDDPATATLSSDVVVTCTSSRRPFLMRDHVRPGTFIAAVGADSADKQELDSDLLAAGRVVADILEQCAEIGELHHAFRSGLMNRSQVSAELGEVVAGSKPGRSARDEITIFDSTGCAIQDAAAAAVVLEQALEKGIGISVKLG